MHDDLIRRLSKPVPRGSRSGFFGERLKVLAGRAGSSARRRSARFTRAFAQTVSAPPYQI